MAKLTATITRDLTWATTDWLELYYGTEDAADLASSTPAGGTLARRIPAWPNVSSRSAAVASSTPGSAVITYTYQPTHKCAVLPVGVIVRDSVGNASAVLETTVQLTDPPRGSRNLSVEATVNPGEGNLTWTASTDLAVCAS